MSGCGAVLISVGFPLHSVQVGHACWLVGCHFLRITRPLLLLCPVLSDFWDPLTVPARLICPWDFVGKMAVGVECHFLLQRIFLLLGTEIPLLQSQTSAGGFRKPKMVCCLPTGNPGIHVTGGDTHYMNQDGFRNEPDLLPLEGNLPDQSISPM